MKNLKISPVKLLQNIVAVLVFALVILLACGVLPVKGGWSFLGSGKDALTVHFITPNGEIVQDVQRGDCVAIDPAEEIENYTFIGWRDTQGNFEKRDSIKVYQNTYYSAVYAVALETNTHKAYLFPNKYGMYLPNDVMTRADAAKMLYSLLAIPIRGTSGFSDVASGDDCYDAVCALKELGVISGSRFHPEEGITRSELLEMVAAFFPASRETYSFSDLNEKDARYPLFCLAAEHDWIDSGSRIKADPDHVLTRIETATLMNRVLGRSENANVEAKQIGYLIDMTQDEDGYRQMVEACVSHDFSREDDAETWTDSEPIKRVSKGFYMFGTDLYAIDRSGHLVKNGEYGGLTFDENGVYTSGDADLDREVHLVLEEILDDSMDREEMLRRIYDYTVESFSYRRRNSHRYQDTSWVMEEAYTMLTTKTGNCYNYAAAFCMLTRAVGYDSKVYSGFVGRDSRAHGWVEIDIDGTTYTFDPELEYAYKQENKIIDMYKLDATESRKWGYKH